MKKNTLIIILIISTITFLNAQTQTQNLNMGLYQLQFPSANGGSNRIQSFGGSFPGKWLFKSRFDDIYLDSGENENNRYKILFLTGGIERARINGNGNFGIKTSNPNSPLAIGYNNGSNQLALQRADGNETFLMYINSSNQTTFKNISGGGDYDFQTNIAGQTITSVLFIEGSNGNIGVGTTNPDMKLTVNGNIHAKEVKIDLNIPAPDYVFKENYNLRSIEELEYFIKANSHLPEIPSAREFEQNGVMQAEMDMNLLKKVEELTLYTIQQQKEIEELKLQNKKLLELQYRLEKLESEK